MIKISLQVSAHGATREQEEVVREALQNNVLRFVMDAVHGSGIDHKQVGVTGEIKIKGSDE